MVPIPTLPAESSTKKSPLPTFKSPVKARVLPSKVRFASAFIASVPVAVRILLFAPLVIKSETSTLNVVLDKSKPVPAEYSVFVSVDAIVTAPSLSVIVTLEPAVKARVSDAPSVFPPAVTVLNVLVSAVISSTTKSIVPSPS